MNCQDVAKLRTPLDAVCQTTDIGCVPIVSGKPTCKPQPDELPIAYDKTSSTLWLFSCDTREWLAFQKFQMCQLNALDLDNIRNICDVLNIGVNYSGTGECQQGTVTLRELAERILECIQLETKIITIGQGEGNKVKITIEGLPLDPVYVQGHNIWSEGGSGTEADPLVVATYDPICKWPTKTQEQVSAADTRYLGACLDGEMARVPYPKQPCEYPQMTEEQVDAAADKQLIACVDGEEARVPYPKFQSPVCEADQLTLEQASAAGSSLTLVGCDDRTVVRIPVSQSGFFDRDYICVPQTIGVPTEPPSQGTGPLRIDCNGNLYVWLCDQFKWLQVRDTMEGISELNPANVSNICENFRMKGWYSNNSDPCVQEAWLTLAGLISIIESCVPSIVHIPGGSGGGCYRIDNITGPTIVSMGNNSIVYNHGDTAVIADWGATFVLALSVKNESILPALLHVVVGTAFEASSYGDDIELGFGYKITEGMPYSGRFDFSQGISPYDSYVVSGGSIKNGYNGIYFSGEGENLDTGNVVANRTITQYIKFAPGESKNIFASPYAMFGGNGGAAFHVSCFIEGYLYGGLK